MTDPLARAQRYSDWAEENVALAKAATSNQVRAHHYAMAGYFHRLAEAEMRAATRTTADEIVPVDGRVSDLPGDSPREGDGRDL